MFSGAGRGWNRPFSVLNIMYIVRSKTQARWALMHFSPRLKLGICLNFSTPLTTAFLGHSCPEGIPVFTHSPQRKPPGRFS
jgi:hypothetical protein